MMMLWTPAHLEHVFWWRADAGVMLDTLFAEPEQEPEADTRGR